MNYLTRLLCNGSRVPIKNYFFETRRHLLSAASLGIDRFLQSKKHVIETFKNKEKFIKEMEEASDCDNDILLFTSDIKNFVMLVTDSNLHIMPKLLKKLGTQNETIKFQKYIFGPDVMKLYYLHNKPKEALSLIEDRDTVQHFIQITSFCVLSDLLFNNGMYQDVIFIYQYFHSRANIQRNAVQALILLYLASCYKLNTKDSLDSAVTLWGRLTNRGVRIHKRGLAFIASLALNHNKPQIAIEVLHQSRPDPLILSLRAMGLAKSKRFEDVFNSLTTSFDENSTLFISSETVNCVRNELGFDKPEYIPKFQRIVDECKAKNQISDKTLDELLLEEVDLSITFKKNKVFN